MQLPPGVYRREFTFLTVLTAWQIRESEDRQALTEQLQYSLTHHTGKKPNKILQLICQCISFFFLNIVWYYFKKKIPGICFLPDCRNIFCSLTIQGLCSLFKFIKLVLNLLGLILVPQVLSHSLQPNNNSLGTTLYPELLRETMNESVS